MSALVPRWEIPFMLRIAWNVGIAGYTALVGVLLLLDDRVPAAKLRWVHSPKLLVTAVSGLILATMLDAIRRAILRAKFPGRERARVGIRNQLSSALVSVAEELSLNVSDFGCGLFLVRGKLWHRPEQLVRPERVRIPDDLHATAVVFTKGKGAVGKCWEHCTTRHNDWIGINQRWAGKEDQVVEKWESIPEKTRRNFTPAEFNSLAGKYAEVLAVPIVDDSSGFVGCIAIDRRWNADDPSERSVLDNQAVKKILGTAAQTLLPLLRK